MRRTTRSDPGVVAACRSYGGAGQVRAAIHFTRVVQRVPFDCPAYEAATDTSQESDLELALLFWASRAYLIRRLYDVRAPNGWIAQLAQQDLKFCVLQQREIPHDGHARLPRHHITQGTKQLRRAHAPRSA